MTFDLTFENKKFNLKFFFPQRLRCEAVRLMRETDEKTSIGQRDAGRRLGERITDVTFWRNELNTELEKLVAEAAQLADVKRNVQKALQVNFS